MRSKALLLIWRCPTPSYRQLLILANVKNWPCSACTQHAGYTPCRKSPGRRFLGVKILCLSKTYPFAVFLRPCSRCPNCVSAISLIFTLLLLIIIVLQQPFAHLNEKSRFWAGHTRTGHTKLTCQFCGGACKHRAAWRQIEHEHCRDLTTSLRISFSRSGSPQVLRLPLPLQRAESLHTWASSSATAWYHLSSGLS